MKGFPSMSNETHKRAADVLGARDSDPEPVTLSPVTYLKIDTESADGQRKYVGRFRYKVPSLGDRIDIGTLKTQLLQSMVVSTDDSVLIAQMIAYLSITIDRKSAPEWWQNSKSGADLYDHAPVVALYQEALEYEMTFLGGSKNAEADREGSDRGSDVAAPGDVEPDVQPPAQRRTVVATLGARSAGADLSAEGTDETSDEDEE
jgi:hypothetical protein